MTVMFGIIKPDGAPAAVICRTEAAARRKAVGMFLAGGKTKSAKELSWWKLYRQGFRIELVQLLRCEAKEGDEA